MNYALGRLPNDPTKPRLKLASFLDTSTDAPASADWLSKITDWPMYGNDTVGDCTCAAAGHMIEQWSGYASSVQEITEDAVMSAYSAVSGYNPNTGANDNGAVMQDVLDYWRKNGIGGHKILAFAEVNVSDLNECRLAVAEFGTIYLGINFPASAMDQFNEGKPWDVVRGSQIEGGHAINAGWYDATSNTWKVVTWGQVQEMTQAFFDKYVEEAWVIATEDWVGSDGKVPTGVDVAALGKQFTGLTGEDSPFPAPSPEPTPQPQPTPDPEPTPEPTPEPPNDVDTELAEALTRILATKSCPSYLRKAVEDYRNQ